MKAGISKISLQIKKKRFIFYTLAVLEIVFLVLTWVVSTGVFASKDYWQIDAGGKTILTVRTESEVREAMSLLKNTYVEEKSRDVRISLNPVISVKHRYYGYMDRKPEVADVEDTRNIAIDSVRRNLISVKTSQTVDKKKRIKFSVIKKKDRAIHRNTSLVKKAGDEGTEIVTVEKTTINGDLQKEEVIKTEVTEKSKDRIIISGTGTSVAKRGKASSEEGDKYSLASGKAVVEFAKKFRGNPYVYGGSSLTKGADCSGFVMAVYKHFGVTLPHDAGADRSLGKAVKSSEMQPGDLVCYYGHIGIYAGDGKIVHAMDEANGITVSRIGYNGKRILTVRRIFG